MLVELIVHPDTPCDFVRSVEVDVWRSGAVLRLDYALRGDLAKLKAPEPAPSARRDGLWRSTCFEVFVRSGEGPAYLEFNLSPSGEWAAYAFSGYRKGMRALEPFPDPEIDLHADEAIHELTARLDLGPAAGFAAGLPWWVGLAAVIESEAGETSYWALAHPPGPPDFHHEDCFALQLPAAPSP